MKNKFEREKKFLLFFNALQQEQGLLYKNVTYIKLQSYEDLLFDCFLWKSRNLYLNLFSNFLNQVVSSDQFVEQFLKIRSNHIKEFNELIKKLELMSQLKIQFEFFDKFRLDSNAFGFSDIIDLTSENCDSFISDELLIELGGIREAGEIDETQLRECIKKAFNEIRIRVGK